VTLHALTHSHTHTPSPKTSDPGIRTHSFLQSPQHPSVQTWELVYLKSTDFWADFDEFWYKRHVTAAQHNTDILKWLHCVTANRYSSVCVCVCVSVSVCVYQYRSIHAAVMATTPTAVGTTAMKHSAEFYSLKNVRPLERQAAMCTRKSAVRTAALQSCFTAKTPRQLKCNTITMKLHIARHIPVPRPPGSSHRVDLLPHKLHAP
jgi:hypothetical protein